MAKRSVTKQISLSLPKSDHDLYDAFQALGDPSAKRKWLRSHLFAEPVTPATRSSQEDTRGDNRGDTGCSLHGFAAYPPKDCPQCQMLWLVCIHGRSGICNFCGAAPYDEFHRVEALMKLPPKEAK